MEVRVLHGAQSTDMKRLQLNLILQETKSYGKDRYHHSIRLKGLRMALF